MKVNGSGKAGPVLVYLVTEDWYFLSHRLPMACEAQRAGYQVHVATHVNMQGAEIEKHGFTLHALDWRRGSFNPFDLVSIVRQVRALYRRLRPDLVHHVALQPSLIGSLAALGLPVMRLNALAGLGFGFTSGSVKARLIRPALSALLRDLLKGPQSAVLVQNPDDRDAITALGVSAESVFLIPGSGVDVEAFKPLPEPAGAITAAFAGRLLDDKGVRVLIAAHDILSRLGVPLKLKIAGERDPANPASIPAAEVETWKSRAGIEVLGHVSDIRQVWAGSHIAVLPSRREGLPKSLLEAAACGRAIVASDVPGCREIARAGVNALLVPPDDAAALAAALERFARDPQMRKTFALAGRRLVENEFSSARIGRQTVALYDRLLARTGALPATATGS
jgi:glycosyltransferase involved in cell wall biosynthesis